jgi:hypothetical protein
LQLSKIIQTLVSMIKNIQLMRPLTQRIQKTTDEYIEPREKEPKSTITSVLIHANPRSHRCLHRF